MEEERKSILTKIKGLPQGAKAAVAFFIASLITKGISYLTTPLFTRLLTVEQYGQVSLFNTWFQIFGIISMFCLMNGVFNNGLLEYKNDRDSYSFSILILSNIITVCFSGILLCIYPLIRSVVKLDVPFIVLMIVLWLLQPAYNFWTARQRYELKYKAVMVWSIVIAISSPLVAVLLLLFFKDEDALYLKIFGAECALAVIYLGFYIYLGIKNRFKVNSHYWKEAFLFNLPLIPHYLSIYLLASSDKIMIANLVGEAETAFYDIGYTVAQIAMMVWTAINATLIPYTYEKCKESKFEDIDKVTRPLLALFAVGCICVILFAPEVVRLMATPEYMEAIYVIPPLIGGVFFQVQYFIYANVVFYYKKPAYIMIGSVTAVIVNLILNYFCVKQWGYMAAAYTTIICYGLQAIIDFFAMKKVVGHSIYSMKYILVLSSAVIGLSIFSLALYNLPFYYRYIIFCLLIVALISCRKRIMRIFVNMKK